MNGVRVRNQAPEISNKPSPIADLEHPFAFSTSNNQVLSAWVGNCVLPTAPSLTLNAKGCSKSAIGDC